MVNELYVFVKEALEKGQDRSAIQQALLEAGWQEEEVKKALASFAQISFPVPAPRPKPYLQAREAFLYLISFIALYITAFSFGALVFAFIDKLFPDPLQFRLFYSSRGLTTALAAIIVAFPLYLFMTRLLGKAAAKDPEHRESKVGKWLTYLTLVIAAGIIIGDLIAVLSGLLGGELTTRFVFKAFTILTIAGSIFGYYLWSLQREERPAENASRNQAGGEKPRAVKIFAGVVMGAIVVAVVYGFTLVGSPAGQRLIQFDERRVSNLQQITFAIDSYWVRNKTLPDNLEDLQDIRYFLESIQDPKTGEPYEYRILSDITYELCATFETDSNAMVNSRGIAKPFSQQIWEHGIGRTCFDREVRKLEVPRGISEPTPVPVR